MKIHKQWTIMAAAVAFAGLTTATLRAAEETEAQLQTEAKITKADAEKTALEKVPHGTIKEGELEREDGKLVWSFDIALPQSKKITEVQVDAKTGVIVSVQVETPKE